MGDNQSLQAGEPPPDNEGQAEPRFEAARDDMQFGGEPGEVAPPALHWPISAEQPTLITNRPPIGPTPVEPVRPVDLGQSLVGQRLEHFELQELVGGGGMGAVFRALDTRLNRIVAIKVLPREQAADEEIVRRFRNEAQSAARLDHDNIVRVYYVGEDKGHHFIAFEFVEGQNLRDLVAERGPLPIADALNFTVQVATALTHASDRDVVHRDIKPSNVLITPDGRAKLADMGLARLHQIERSGADLTQSGVTLGTFDYISPEQARDPRNADVRSDIYSLGCTLFFMLTGRPPFPEGTVLQKLLQHQADEPPDPRQFNPQVPAPLVRVLHKMMAKEPRQRQQGPDELIVELLNLAGELGLNVPATDAVVVAEAVAARARHLERYLVWGVPIGALLLIFAILSWRQGRTASEPWLAPGAPVKPTENAPLAEANRPAIGGSKPFGQSASPVVIRARDVAAAQGGTGKQPPGASGQPPPAATREPAQSDPRLAGPRNSVGQLLDQLRGPNADGLDAGAVAAEEASAAATAIDGNALSAGGSASDPPPGPTPSSAGQQAGPPRQQGVLIVAPGHEGEGFHPSLYAACAAAESGNVIELRFDGPREEKPIDLRNQKLTIRSAEGFHPLIVFRPSETDPVKFPRSMLTVSGGRLALVNLALELDLPRELPADSWSLFRLQQAEALQLEHCAVTIRNASEQGRAYHEDVAFLRLVGAPGSGSMMGTEEIAMEPLSIQLRDCLVRGEATFLAHFDVQPCHLSWTNGLLATTDRLLESHGGRKAPRSGDELTLDLRHLTADVRKGLCLLTNTADAPYQLPTEIRLANSIVLGTPDAAMIEQSGIDTVRDFHRRLAWESERNFYDSFKTFRKIRGQDAREEPQVMELSGWAAFWGAERSWGPVVWKKLPDPARALSGVVAADYRLDDQALHNGALRGATDGRDAGCDLLALPQPETGTTGGSREANRNRLPAAWAR
jgi:serine/threonine-protein kinase